MSRKFKNTESYAHLYSKQVVNDWLHERWQHCQKNHRPVTFCILDWVAYYNESNRGIFEEYPILSRCLKNGEKEFLGINPIWDKIPDIEKCKERGLTVETVFDVAISSHKKLKYGLELVWKHPCSKSKIAFLKWLKEKHGVKTYELDALWVLSQVRCPTTLKMREVS